MCYRMCERIPANPNLISMRPKLKSIVCCSDVVCYKLVILFSASGGKYGGVKTISLKYDVIYFDNNFSEW